MHSSPADGHSPQQLDRALKARHVTMISIGGIIGAGLFIGSSSVMAMVGPAVVVSYLLAGTLVFLIMRMLGELAVSRPGVSSFTEYTREPLGDWAAFLCGWLYTYFWIIVVAVEAIAGAAIVQHWIALPVWLISAGLLGALTLVNLFSVKLYGEFEFWFASVKVAAIMAFLLLGVSYLAGFPAGAHPAHTMFGDGGFAPRGAGAILAGVPAVIFSICGAEIAAIAAAESSEPAKNVARIAQTVILRVLFFYVGSSLVIMAIVPWASIVPGQSPFVQTMRTIHVPFAAEAITLVILTAVLSCLNSGLYVASRVLHGLALRGDAPRMLRHLDRNRTPVAAVLAAAVIALICALASAISYSGLFSFLLNASGAIMLIVYMLVALAQIRGRRMIEREDPSRLLVRMWLFPGLSWCAIAAIAAILLTMAVGAETRSQFYATAALVGLLLAVRVIIGLLHRGESTPILPTLNS